MIRTENLGNREVLFEYLLKDAISFDAATGIGNQNMIISDFSATRTYIHRVVSESANI